MLALIVSLVIDVGIVNLPEAENESPAFRVPPPCNPDQSETVNVPSFA